MTEKHPKVPAKNEKITSLKDLGAAFEAHREAQGTHAQEPSSAESNNILSYEPKEAEKPFSPQEANKPAGMERLPDESLPEYRARMKSTLAQSIAGVSVKGVDISNVSVKLPPRKRTLAQDVKEREDKQRALDDAINKAPYKDLEWETRVEQQNKDNDAEFVDRWDRREAGVVKKSIKESGVGDTIDKLTPSKRKKAEKTPGKGDESSKTQKDHTSSNEETPAQSKDIVLKGDGQGTEDAEFFDIPGQGNTEGFSKNDSLEYLGVIGGTENTSAHPDIRSSLESQRQEAEQAQTTYFEAIKKFQKERHGFGVAMEGLLGDKTSKDEELKELRRAWVRSRAAFARGQLESVDARLQNRTATPEAVLEGLKNYKGKGHFTPAEIKARYERMVTIRSTVLGAEEAEQKARIDGLSERDKGRFEKVFDWYKKQPTWARIATTSALMFGGAALMGSGVGLAMLGLGGGRIAASTLAEMKAGTLAGSRFALAARVFGIGAIAGLAAEGAVRGAHWVAGTKHNANELLAKKKGFGDLTNEENFENLSDSRKKALGAQETIARHGRIARIAASLTGGWLFGHAMHGDTAPANSGSGSVEDLNHVKGGPIAPEAPAPIHTESLSIHGKVFDADRLFGHFRDQLTKEYPDLSKAPASVRTLIEHTEAQDPLTKWLGFQGKDGLSAMMHEGDTVSVQPNGELVFTTAAGQQFTVIDAQGKMHEFDLTKFHTTGGHHAEVHPKAAPAVTPEKTAPVVSSEATSTADVTPTPTPSPSSAEAEVQPDASPLAEGSSGGADVSDTPVVSSADIGDPNTLGTGAPTDIIPPSGANSIPSPTTLNSADIGSPEDLTPASGTDATLGALNLNAHNIPVDITSPHEYVMKLPGSDTERLFAFGGSTAATSDMAREYVTSAGPNSSMYFVVERTNLLGIVESRSVSEWVTDATGKVTLNANPLDAAGNPISVPETNDFIRVIK